MNPVKTALLCAAAAGERGDSTGYMKQMDLKAVDV